MGYIRVPFGKPPERQAAEGSLHPVSHLRGARIAINLEPDSASPDESRSYKLIGERLSPARREPPRCFQIFDQAHLRRPAQPAIPRWISRRILEGQAALFRAETPRGAGDLAIGVDRGPRWQGHNVARLQRARSGAGQPRTPSGRDQPLQRLRGPCSDRPASLLMPMDPPSVGPWQPYCGLAVDREMRVASMCFDETDSGDCFAGRGRA